MSFTKRKKGGIQNAEGKGQPGSSEKGLQADEKRSAKSDEKEQQKAPTQKEIARAKQVLEQAGYEIED